MECIPLSILQVLGEMSAEIPPEVIVSWLRWGVVKERTGAFAENWNSRGTSLFSMMMFAALLCQIWADWSVITTDSVQ